MKSKEFIQKAINIAKNYKTLYVMGCFGAPMNDKNKKRYCDNINYNRQPERTAMIKAASSDTFGFDCVCLIKGILWGWSGDTSKAYGGSKYASNGVPDINADKMIEKCKDVSNDFYKIVPGEAVWKPGHIGIYIGDGLAVECTPSWDNKVQITAVANKGSKPGYNSRSWMKHGKLPYVDYSDQNESKPVVKPEAKPDVIYQVYADGRWLPTVTNFNDTNSSGYAGIIGKEISGIRVKLSNKKTVTVRSHICGKVKTDWLAPITKWNITSNGYSGWKGKPTDCISMKADGVKLKYRVHVKGGDWLAWVTDYDINNYRNGLAGIYGEPIDAVQIDVMD